MALDLRHPVLLYDGDCRLCRFAAQSVARLDRDGALLLLPLDDPEAIPLLGHLPPAERDATWRLLIRGTTLGYGRGAVELARVLPLTRPVARVLERVPPGVLDALYGVVARHRGRLGRVVPDVPAPRRYPDAARNPAAKPRLRLD